MSVPASALASIYTYLDHARWFGGKGRGGQVTGVRVLTEIGPATVYAVEVAYPDGDTDLYQVPMIFSAEPIEGLDHAFVGWWEDSERGWVHAYDAVHDRDAISAWLPEVDAVPSVFSGEQSNTTVFFGEDAVLKVFRRLVPGTNPDVEIHRALTDAGSTHVAHLIGSIEAEGYTLAMAQQFLRTATDGWEVARASARNLLADPLLRPAESGGDFASEAARLGESLAQVHLVLAAEFGTGTADASAIASQMTTRLDDAVRMVPELAAHEATARAAFEALASLADVPVQRVHGDLHLGQTMRTSLDWKFVDFEGEPLKTLQERVTLDSVWRDVAGMLRSFEYAGAVVARNSVEPDAAEHAASWARRNQRAFVAAYAPDGLSESEMVLLTAYVVDKLIYEVIYEAHNRPGWIDIPLAGLTNLPA